MLLLIDQLSVCFLICSDYSVHALKQQHDEVEGVDFELFEEGPTHVPLGLVLLHERDSGVQLGEPLHLVDLLASAELLVNFEEQVQELVETLLLLSQGIPAAVGLIDELDFITLDSTEGVLGREAVVPARERLPRCASRYDRAQH